MTQRYMLDTNIVSHIMQGRDAALLARLSQLPMGQAVMSSVTLAELEYGLPRKGNRAALKMRCIKCCCVWMCCRGTSL